MQTHPSPCKARIPGRNAGQKARKDVCTSVNTEGTEPQRSGWQAGFSLSPCQETGRELTPLSSALQPICQGQRCSSDQFDQFRQSSPHLSLVRRGDECAVGGERRGRRRGVEGKAAAGVCPPGGQPWKARKQAPGSSRRRFVWCPVAGGGGAAAPEEADDGAGGGQGQTLLLAVLPRLEAPHLPGQKHGDAIPYYYY